jgi:hypothetical protein
MQFRLQFNSIIETENQFMKQIILFFLLTDSVISTFSQQTNPSPALLKQDYLEKCKKQKTAAWLLLGGGSVIGFIGLATFNFAGSDDGDVNNSASSILFFTGTAAVISSIPFFISSKKNKRKAMSLSFKNEKMKQLYKSSSVYKNIPSLNLKFNL